MPPPHSASTTLWPGAKSAIVAACSANGAQTSVGVPPSPQEKSRSAMVPSSRWTRCGVVHTGRGFSAGSCSAGRRASEAAKASPTLAAIKAGHANRLAGNSGTCALRNSCFLSVVRLSMVQLSMVETSCRRWRAALTGINPRSGRIMPRKAGLFQRFSEPEDAQGE